MPWSSFGSIDAATTTDAGMAFMIRIALALAMWIVLFQYRLDHPDVYWTAVSLPGIALLATWAFAGHSTSMQWPTIGVVTDVAHHAAAAAWIAAVTEASAGADASISLNAADIEFAQGMIAHHEQAVEMAEIALDPNVDASAEVTDLATGAEFDQMWLEMMIAHHEGAVSQSETVKANGSNPDVLLLADQIIAAQQGEIAEMQALLGS